MLIDAGTYDLVIGQIPIVLDKIDLPNRRTIRAKFDCPTVDVRRLYSFVEIRLAFEDRNSVGGYTPNVWRLDPFFSPLVILFEDHNDWGRQLDLFWVLERRPIFAPAGDTSNLSVRLEYEFV